MRVSQRRKKNFIGPYWLIMRMTQCGIQRNPGIGCTYMVKKIQQCEILLDHTSSIQSLKTVPSSLATTICSDQVPPTGTGEMGGALSAKWDAAQADALAALQLITQKLPQPHVPPQDLYPSWILMKLLLLALKEHLSVQQQRRSR